MAGQVTYIDVLLPLALPQRYTYAVPFDWVTLIYVGQRVIVRFGGSKHYTAVICRIHHDAPVVAARLIESLADEQPIVTAQQLRLWEWMADYYLCTEGEVLNAALPAGLKLSSETRIRINEYYDGDYEALTADEFAIVQALRIQTELTVKQAQDIIAKKNIYAPLRTLMNAGIALSSEEMISRYKPRTESYISLETAYRGETQLQELYETMGRAPKQLAILLAYTQLSHRNTHIRKAELLQRSAGDAAILKRLVEKGVFKEYKVEVSRLGAIHSQGESTAPVLSASQAEAVADIKALFETKSTVLLHGVTSSGKTQVYIELIAEMLRSGKQVLYMLPEIALTAQIINRLKNYFGQTIGVYHSRFNPHERVEIWNKVLDGSYRLIVSARSGLFLPFQDLGLVIVDEEHDASLKQMDPSPRYHARDSAIMLASYHGARVLLGSATPSVETYYNALRGKYGLVKLTKRYGDVAMPTIVIEDTKRERQRKAMHGSFTEGLTIAIKQSLAHQEQTILFINRRGFSQFQTCRTCGYIYKCKRCDVSLTHHKYQNRLLCHYCGYSETLDSKCISCGTIDLDIVGMGTERIEEEIAALFPEAKVGRLDLDTTRGKNGHGAVIASFENREIDILVGTQMVTKGLDFDHVTVVGVVNADQALFFPGYRSNERAFQMMMQVGGRAGRRDKQGTVVIQTSQPQHPVIQYVLAHNYEGYYASEMTERQQYHYPPYERMVQITLRHLDVQVVEQASLFLANAIRKTQVGELLGPTLPLVSKIKNLYLREILIKTAPHTPGLVAFKQAIRESIMLLRAERGLRAVHVLVDVDP
jgi:primosomal protein N' (replication factor Y) (superfamily II helicase)